MPASAEQPPLEHFSWLNVGGDGFAVAGRSALDVKARTWPFVPAGAGPVGLGDAAAVWAVTGCSRGAPIAGGAGTPTAAGRGGRTVRCSDVRASATPLPAVDQAVA